MKLLKVKLHEKCQLVAVADDKEVILTAGAFTSDEDAETAGNVLYTLLCNLGLLKEHCGAPRLTVEELLKETKTTAQAYVKELVEA